MSICIKKYFYLLSGVQAFGKQNHTKLQQQGIHKYIRHPLYLGTLLFIWGLFLLLPTIANLIACIIIQLYVLVGISFEEKKLYLQFGEDYKLYSIQTSRLIPRLLIMKWYKKIRVL